MIAVVGSSHRSMVLKISYVKLMYSDALLSGEQCYITNDIVSAPIIYRYLQLPSSRAIAAVYVDTLAMNS